MHKTLKIIRIALKEKMAAMPTARQMTMDTTPALKATVSILRHSFPDGKAFSDATAQRKPP